MRASGLLAITLWDVIVGWPAGLFFHEDNQAMIRVCETGRKPTVRHIERTHRVSIAGLHERFTEPGITLFYEESTKQAADIYTKAITHAMKLDAA